MTAERPHPTGILDEGSTRAEGFETKEATVMQTTRWEETPVEQLTHQIERRVLWGQQATLARFSLGKGRT